MTISAKIGFGPKVAGEIVVLGKPGEIPAGHEIDPSFSGKILMFFSYAPRELLEKASLVGVRGVVVPSMHWRDFDYFVKADDFSLLVLTKFGRLDISSELFEKLSKLDGKKAELGGEDKTLTVK